MGILSWVGLLAALVGGIEKDEAEAIQTILRGHTMEADERSLWRQSNLELFNAHKLWLTLLSVVTQVHFLFSLIEDHIADTLLVTRKNADSVWLVMFAKLPRLRSLKRLRIIANHCQLQRAVLLTPQADLQGYQVVVPILILESSDRC